MKPRHFTIEHDGETTVSPISANMTDLLARYISGDCQAVREALIASVKADSSSEQLAIATAIADEFASRSIDNLSRLYDALLTLGYQFADPANALVLNDSPDADSVKGFEEQMGQMPLLASRWYRRIKSVDFTQTYEQLTDQQSPLAGLGWNALFIVQSLDTAREHWLEHCRQCEEDDMHRIDAGMPAKGPEPPALFTGGCASNNECKGFELPSFRFDDVLYNDGGGDQYFGDEIAEAFLCGGFPVLSASVHTLKVVCTLYGEPNKQFLSTRLPDNFQKV